MGEEPEVIGNARVVGKVPEEMDVARGIAEVLTDGASREALDEGGAEGFITPLPVALGMQEVRGIVHAPLSHMAAMDVIFNS